VILIIAPPPGIAQAIPEPPPYDGEEDQQEIVVTVGEMKQALWYYEQYKITYPEYVRVQEELRKTIRQRDLELQGRLDAEQSIEIWRSTALVVGGVTIGTIIYIFTAGSQ